MQRRTLLKAIPALFCAPAVVKASSLMKIAPPHGLWPLAYNWYVSHYEGRNIMGLSPAAEVLDAMRDLGAYGQCALLTMPDGTLTRIPPEKFFP